MRHLLLITTLCVLSGCGVKPSSLQAPSDLDVNATASSSDQKPYPRTYPDRGSDPTPVPGY